MIGDSVGKDVVIPQNLGMKTVLVGSYVKELQSRELKAYLRRNTVHGQ